MQENYTLGLVLLDFVPNIAFLAGAFFLVRITRRMRGKPCSRMMMAGTLLVFLGGFLKATWKLIYVLGIANITAMSEAQFILLAPGFFGMLVAVILLARTLSGRDKKTDAVAAIAAWKIPLLATMTLSSLGAQGILTYLSFQARNRLAAAMFIIAVLCMLGMSGMASGSEQTITNQWIEEGMNSFGQIAFALGSYLLYRMFKSRPESGVC